MNELFILLKSTVSFVNSVFFNLYKLSQIFNFIICNTDAHLLLIYSIYNTFMVL